MFAQEGCIKTISDELDKLKLVIEVVDSYKKEKEDQHGRARK